jgi:hypothetical protein
MVAPPVGWPIVLIKALTIEAVRSKLFDQSPWQTGRKPLNTAEGRAGPFAGALFYVHKIQRTRPPLAPILYGFV